MGEAIGLIRDGRLIAGFAFTNYRGSSCEVHIAGNETSGWMKNRHFLQSVANYVYSLECIRLTAPVPESEQRLIKMLLRAGLTLEAMLARAHYGKNLWLMVLWLDKPNLLTRLDIHGRRRLSSET
jgi:hypothetical protein